MECDDYGLTRTLERENLNLNPLQRGGVLPAEAREALYEFSDGYSICDYCEGRLDQIKKPDINRFLDDLADFINIDLVRTVHGAREGKFAVMHALCNKGDTIIVDGNAHYTTHLAAERNHLKIIETPNNGHPTFEIKPETYKQTLEDAIDKTEIKLAVLTHVDGDYGNLTNAKAIASTCKKLGVPLLLNCAYSMGRMPIDAKDIGADFIVGSGHKSMAASGPIGVLGMTSEWEDTVLKRSERHEKKEIEMLGCTSRGAPIATLMASFPHVKERVQRWDEEVKKTRHFVKEMEKLGEIIQLGVKPKEHDLVRFETPIFDNIARSHPRRGFFLYEELKRRRIVGIKRGQTRWFKCSVYSMTMEQIEYIINTFKDIIKKYQP
ncbi:MAG TPA: O-phospho-L-seryl-tRNA:Cys-tRNA synthase [Methanothermobacter sp.]|uniref:O-phospho-L-seryl-tRNA:Cys-tRNA synthase n=1 Tax=Methanothermobacter tenebrarum TaxID=680118 RepID=A0ABN6PAS1_9EURY|nr:O-phospho-L-seryl-tRNA:Cys-tRNA synthase [Methanothermobacter tenebrarum]MDI6882009.1 O-phospho-L-seryl-tRNA:Cys-tRNA synthase [Methanothermobacter sp.]BDH78988.1 O-phospho-L-seryl-tRNA:Cys-tRNA synthase [Methanothermobacter tenebrarum]HHW16887.1 O-phospho-L-seryl-tRNA:Cys-tRNA synthase [Methanothermobacter sp.]HOQ20774.1 O-phospho-L-seryl-tRNA:Cys-tRNA synthase [Methanothermobacter sp.]